MGPGSYRVLARTCTFGEARPNGGLITPKKLIAEHQNLTDQFLLPACIEWTGKQNIYATSNDSEVASQRLVHRHYFPTLESLGIVERVKEVHYRYTDQTVWKINADKFLENLASGTFKSGTADLAIVSSRKINLSMNGQAVTIEKGEVIPAELQKQVNPSDTKVGVVMVGEFTPTGGGTTQSVFSSTDQDDFTRAYFKGDKGEKKLIIDAQETLKKRLENLNALSPEKRNEILQKYDSWTDYLNSDESQQTSAPATAPAKQKSGNGMTTPKNKTWLQKKQESRG
jgi:hypothetical protein